MPTITPEHVQRTTLHIVEYIPSHETRTTDPYYHYFNAAKNRMKAAGLLKCWVCGTEDDVECHHSIVEFCFGPDYDWSKLAADHPEFGIVDDDTFQKFVEGEGNITPLCRLHHTGIQGIHNLPGPIWNTFRYLKAGAHIPGEIERAS